MIKPTIGRVVWVHRSNLKGVTDAQPEVGLITYVHDDATIAVVGWDKHGDSFRFTHLPIYQGEGDRPEVHYAEWMPYQKGQAAKTEALEKQIESGTPR